MTTTPDDKPTDEQLVEDMQHAVQNDTPITDIEAMGWWKRVRALVANRNALQNKVDKATEVLEQPVDPGAVHSDPHLDVTIITELRDE